MRPWPGLLIFLLIIAGSCRALFSRSEALAPTPPGPGVAATLAMVGATQTALTASTRADPDSLHLPETTAASPTATPLLPAVSAQIEPTAIPTTARPNLPLAPGSISGLLVSPGGELPPLRVTAFEEKSGQTYFIDTDPGQSTFRIDNLPAGTYHVVVYHWKNQVRPQAAGYTEAVLCGLALSCTDHSLIPVIVNPARDTPGVSPVDWHAPVGSFPSMPEP